MAESESGADKTEDPTDKRKRDSREQGEVIRSKELNTVAVMLAGTGACLTYGGALAQTFLTLMQKSFMLPREVIMQERYMQIFLLQAAKDAYLATQPILLALLLASLLSPLALGGWLFAAGGMAPKFSRMNPLSGVKRMFSINSVIELLKAIGKFVVILMVALAVLRKDQLELLAIAKEPLDQAIIHSVQVVGWSSVWMAAGLLIIAAIDVPIQIYQGRQKLLMTKQEVRDEYKDAEGRPEVKGRIRQMQREASQRRMMANVPTADVIITNPTHYAVALKYDPEQGGAPILLAKGTDFVALKIREIAVAHEIQLLESPALARSIYYSTEVDAQIPAGLYMAVAQVLAYVYQIRQHRAGRGKRPKPLDDLPIPDELKRDADPDPPT